MRRLFLTLVLAAGLVGRLWAAIDYATLKTELQTDPVALGYAASVSSGNDTQAAVVINAVRAGIMVRRDDITPTEIASAIDVADYTALSGTPTAAQLSAERRYLAWLTAIFALPSVRLLNNDGTDGPTITNFKALFPAGSATRNRLIVLASRPGSRAEQLFGAGTTITPQDVAKALR